VSIPLVTFADPEVAVVDYLTTALAGRSESYTSGVTVGAFYPRSSTDAPVQPFVQVSWDGTPTVPYPITERATIRVTCWADNPGPAKLTAQLVQGLLAVHPGDTGVFAVQILTGPLPARDPDTGLFGVSLTCRVSLRPTAA